MKRQVFMKSSKVKILDKQTKKEPTIRFWYETKKSSTQKEYIHNMVSQTADNIEYNSMKKTLWK